MPVESPRDRVMLALRGAGAFEATLRVAEQLRDEGMSQSEMLELFDTLRAHHEGDSDGSQYNAVLDVMDRIVGWCSPGKKLYNDPC